MDTSKWSLGTEADEQRIWTYFMERLHNPYGVAGLMGNLYAESGLRSYNLQRTYELSLSESDLSYTEKVDNGTYANFVTDSAGYGLAQWTYSTRKQGLLDRVKALGTTIADMDVQLEYIWTELQWYPAVLQTLKTAKSVRVASDSVLKDYEAPANTGIGEQVKRSAYGEMYYRQYAMPKSPSKDVKLWQRQAIKDGFSFPAYGADGLWGAECESVARQAVIKNREPEYLYPHLTRLVQRRLRVKVDGLCGQITAGAIADYQKSHGLTVDGCVGINTWKSLLGV